MLRIESPDLGSDIEIESPDLDSDIDIESLELGIETKNLRIALLFPI
jgi:hypothetical protein